MSRIYIYWCIVIPKVIQNNFVLLKEYFNIIQYKFLIK